MKTITNTTALITDIDRRKSIPIIRSLGKKGIRVIGMSYQSYPIGKTSRYCKKYYRCPNYNAQPRAFLKRLKEICTKEKPDVLYPIEDVVLSLCVKNPGYWKPHTNAVLPDPDVLDICYDKWKTMQIAKKCGIRTPITYCPISEEELITTASTWNGAAVIKPRKSSGSRGMVYVEDSNKLLEAYRKVAKNYHRPLIQEKLPRSGKGLGVFLLFNRDSELIAVFGHKRIREYPVAGGPSTLRVSYYDSSLIQQTIDFFRKINFSGVAMAEYKIDHRTNTPVLLEINPRFWGSLQLAISSDVDFPFLYHQLSLGIEPNPKLNFNENIFCRWLLPGDFLHFLFNPKRLELRPSFFNFFTQNMNYDICSLDDPLPIIGIFIESLRRLLHKS